MTAEEAVALAKILGIKQASDGTFINYVDEVSGICIGVNSYSGIALFSDTNLLPNISVELARKQYGSRLTEVLITIIQENHEANR